MQNQKNLIQATADFEHWRQTRINKHASIPDELRCLALKLLEEYPISHVTKALRICTTQLNDWRKQLPVKSSAPDFVPLQIEPDLRKQWYGHTLTPIMLHFKYLAAN